VSGTLPSVKMRIQERMETLTPSERQLVSVLLQDYPVSGLGSITEVARTARVSTPTVIRTARKLGFDGFPDMQGAIRTEIAAQIREPISRRDAGRASAPDDHTLNQFAEAVSSNIRSTLQRLNPEMFDAVVRILADPARPVYLAGGRVTRSNADYFFNHLQIIRPAVTLLSQSPNVWPQYLLDIDAGAVLILFDIRRYETDLQKFAKLARDRDCTIILFTDQWGSPISRLADHCFHALVEAPSSWDSTIAIMMIVEALIADIQSARLEESKGRIEELEAMFSKTKLFRNIN
jgi:DNA-binding MurR/RpiR family transcriptional regulator